MARERIRRNPFFYVLHARKRRHLSLVELGSSVTPQQGRIHAIYGVYHVSDETVSAVHHRVKLSMSRASVSPRTCVHLDSFFDAGSCCCRFSLCAMFFDESFDPTLHFAEAHLLQQLRGYIRVSPLPQFFESVSVDRYLRVQVFCAASCTDFPDIKERCGHVSPVRDRPAPMIDFKLFGSSRKFVVGGADKLRQHAELAAAE